MAQEIKLGMAQVAFFEVTDASRASGFGLHVAASDRADGKGMYAECFLHAEASGEVKLVYIDGGRSSKPLIDLPGGVLGPAEVLPPAGSGGTAGGSVAGLSAIGEPVGMGGTVMIGGDAEHEPPDTTLDPDALTSELRGSHRFEIPLGPRSTIQSIIVRLSGWQLMVDCTRRSAHTSGRPRRFHVGGGVFFEDGDLGTRPVLFYSSNGLLSGGQEGAGSGWKTKKPQISKDGHDSVDGTLMLGGHDNDDPIEPVGG